MRSNQIFLTLILLISLFACAQWLHQTLMSDMAMLDESPFQLFAAPAVEEAQEDTAWQPPF